MKKMPAAYLHGEAAQQNQRGIDPQDGRQRDGTPIKNPGIGSSEMAAALASKKSTDQGDKEHQVAGQSEKQHHAVAAQQIARSTPAGLAVFPILTVATAACRPAGNRWLAAESGILALCVDRGAG